MFTPLNWAVGNSIKFKTNRRETSEQIKDEIHCESQCEFSQTKQRLTNSMRTVRCLMSAGRYFSLLLATRSTSRLFSWHTHVGRMLSWLRLPDKHKHIYETTTSTTNLIVSSRILLPGRWQYLLTFRSPLRWHYSMCAQSFILWQLLTDIELPLDLIKYFFAEVI